MSKTYLEKSWADPRIQVKTSLIEGQGGFATELIKQGEIVVILGGIPMTNRQFQAFTATPARYDAVQIGEDLHLVDLSPGPHVTNGSLNHACDSNCWMQDEVTIVARRDILTGEELTIDYALFTTLPQWRLDLPCRCASRLCRHTVTGNDWKLLDVQNRYCDHFSPFINACIASLKSN